ncbi:hypothetical protein RYX36_027981, partial [Vicia faba]
KIPICFACVCTFGYMFLDYPGCCICRHGACDAMDSAFDRAGLDHFHIGCCMDGMAIAVGCEVCDPIWSMKCFP